MKISILVFPGSNCDLDIANCLYQITNKKPSLIWYLDNIEKKTDLIILPGGFSFGDYLRSGAIASKTRIIKSLKSLVSSQYLYNQNTTPFAHFYLKS